MPEESFRRGSSVRLKDIADVVGCSVGLVSHVINRSYGNITCKPDLQRKILEAAESLGYDPMESRRVASSLKSNVISVLMGAIPNGEMMQLLAGFEETAQKFGYILNVIGFSNDVSVSKAVLINLLKKKSVDGVIIMIPDKNIYDEISQHTKYVFDFYNYLMSNMKSTKAYKRIASSAMNQLIMLLQEKPPL